MKQSKKVMAVLVITMMGLAFMPLAAQTSNTNKATADNFDTDVDNYMSVTDYGEVAMEKWFGFAGFEGTALSLGYARLLGPLYLGTYYTGTVLFSNQKETVNVDTTPSILSGIVVGKTVKTDTFKDNADFTTNNTASVLIGTIGMGFRLNFTENLTTASGRLNASGNAATDTVTVNDSTNTKTGTEWTDGSKLSGYMIPSVAWGMNLPLSGMTLKPTALIGVNFNMNSNVYTRNVYTEINGMTPIGTPHTVTTGGNSINSLLPYVNLGAELVMAEKDATQKTFGLSYSLNLGLYSNNYVNVSGSDENVKGFVSWSNSSTVTETIASKTVQNTNTANILEYSSMSHRITPSFRYTKDVSDRVSFGLNTTAPIILSSSLNSSKTVTTTITNVQSFSSTPSASSVTTTISTTPGDTVNTTELTVSPAIKGGLTYSVIPKVFVLKAGLSINAPSFRTKTETKTRNEYYKSTTTTVDGSGAVTNTVSYTGSTVDLDDTRTESQDVTNAWGSLGAVVSGGFTLNVAENIAFDALMNNSGVAKLDATTFSLIFTIKK